MFFGVRTERDVFFLDELETFHVKSLARLRVAVSVIRQLGLPAERTNPNGSGISLGHPIGATGTILAVKALYELERIGGR